MKTLQKLNFLLDSRLCKSCGICIAICPQAVLAANGNAQPVPVNADSCVLCKLCEYHCPDFAIRVEGIDA